MKKILIIIGLVVLIIFGYGQLQKNDNDLDSHGHDHDEENYEQINSLEHINYLGSYSILDEEFGTDVTVTIDLENNTRTIVSNAIPNHDTGIFPNQGNPNTISEQDKTWVYPLNPTWTGSATWAREPGVSINGVKIEPETNERVVCETGEQYRIEAKQSNFDLGLDFNNAHVQPTGEYHYHGVSDAMIEAFDQGEDLVHIGFAADGYLIYYSKSGEYKSSYQLSTEERTGELCTYTTHTEKVVDVSGVPDGTYVSDWEYVEGLGDLDACNGTTINGEYVYLMTDDYPFSGRCLNGEVESEVGGAPNGQPGPGGEGRQPLSGGPGGQPRQ